MKKCTKVYPKEQPMLQSGGYCKEKKQTKDKPKKEQQKKKQG